MAFRIQCVVGGASWYVESGLARDKTICEIPRGGKIRLTSVRNDLRNFARALKAGISTFEHPRRCSSVAFHSFCARAKFGKSVSNILIRIPMEILGFGRKSPMRNRFWQTVEALCYTCWDVPDSSSTVSRSNPWSVPDQQQQTRVEAIVTLSRLAFEVCIPWGVRCNPTNMVLQQPARTSVAAESQSLRGCVGMTLAS